MNLLKLRCTNKNYEVFHREDRLCCFGWSDFDILPDCNINYDSCSLLGYSYEYSSTNDKYALAGSKHFKVLEIEVYKVL